MSTILRLIGALALLGPGALALPHPDVPSATTTATPTTDPVTTPAPSTTPETTPAPSSSSSTSSLPLGEVPYEGRCDWSYCNSVGLSVCYYWGGITGYDSRHNPVPGETLTTLGPCSTVTSEVASATITSA
ncbi:hypothetical protein F4820DRAFT_417072 [Hypoxylon rubiginosum]|uniref:Uncharacterized protein n=1 Tax=Hypoxylon rubiginosum TaxID=110542 RepID=A0ACB9Z488_9PEZI|nr:hypothetical protein F4820DRAFT_417072 [Hypoxylon rubiginosum]